MNTNQQKASYKLGWIICALGAIFYSYEYLLRIAPSVMVNDLRAYFDISAAGLGTLVGLYYMAYTPMQVLVGAIMDLIGPRRILTFAAAVCAIGTFIFGYSHTLWLAGVGRFMVGFGSAFAFVGALKLAAVWLPTNRFAMFSGLVTSLGMFGAMMGDVGLTHLVQGIGWQTTLFWGGIAGIILVPIIWLIIRDHPKGTVEEHHQLDFNAFIKNFSAIVKNPQIWLSGMVACMLYLALSAFGEMWGIPFLETTYHFSAQQAAAVNSLIFLGWLVAGPAAGWASDRLRNRRRFLMTGSLLAALCIGLVLYETSLSIYTVGVLLFLFGVFSSVEVICFAIGYESASHQVAGTAVAFVNMLTMLGGFVFQPLIGKLMDSLWNGQMQNGLRVYSPHDYRVALSTVFIGMIVSAVFSFHYA